MPKTLLDFMGYSFFFYSNEGDEPVHVHVSKGSPSDNNAKFWIIKKMSFLHGLSILKNN